jgi:hypothetical protein
MRILQGILTKLGENENAKQYGFVPLKSVEQLRGDLTHESNGFFNPIRASLCCA